MKEKIADLKNKFIENTDNVRIILINQTREFESFYDDQTELFNNHFPFVQDPYYDLRNHEQIVLQSFYKAHTLLFTSYKLLLDGNYGASNMLIRGVFEYLLVGKYFSVKKDPALSDKWLTGSNFDVYDKAIKCLQTQQKQAFHEFWRICCNDNHAMTHSLQIGFDISDKTDDIRETFSRLVIMQICCYHLLSSHIINNRLKYRSEFYGRHKNRNSELKASIAVNIMHLKARIAPIGHKLIGNYKAKWTFTR